MSRKTNSPFTFALGALAINILMMLFQSYSNNYYVEHLGLLAIYATIAKIVMLLFDALINLYAGYKSDNNKNQKGRRYPWLVSTAPLYAIITILVFLPLSTENQLIILAYLVVTMLVFQFAATFQFINYGALFPQIYQDKENRIKAANWRQALTFIGLVIGIALPPVLFDKVGFFVTAIIYGIIYAVIFSVFLLGIKEPKTTSNENQISLKGSFSLLKDKKFVFYNLTNAIVTTINGILITVYPFLAKYYLKIDGLFQTILLSTIFLSAIITTFIWRIILFIIDEEPAWIISIIILCVGIFSFYFLTNKYLYLVSGVIIGFGLSGAFMIPSLINAKLLDLDYKKFQIRREAVFNSISNLIGKFSMIISALFFGIFTLIFDYQSGDNPGPRPALMFKTLVCIVPLFLGGIAIISAFIFQRLFNKDQKHII